MEAYMSYVQWAPQDRLQRIFTMLDGTLCGAMIKDVQRTTKAPPEMVLAVMLANLSAMVQSKAKVNLPDIGVVLTALYILIEALSNERKSAVAKKLNRASRDFERRMNRQRKELAAQKAQEEEAAGKSKRKKSDKSNNHPYFQLIVKDATSQGLLTAIEQGNWSLCQDIDEGAKFFRSVDIPMYCSAWSGDPHVVNRASKPSFVLEDSSIAACIMIQPGRLDDVLKRKGDALRDSGFLGRTLFTSVITTQGTRINNPYEVEAPESEISERFYERCMQLLESAQHDNLDGPPEREIMELDAEARVLLRQFYNEMEELLAPGRMPEGVREQVGKAGENAGRIAAILCYFETLQCSINANWVHIARQLMYYFIDQARARFAVPSPQEQRWLDAEVLMTWITQHIHVNYQGVSLSELQRGGPSHLRRRDALYPALDLLLYQGRLVRQQRGNKTYFSLPMAQVMQPVPSVSFSF